VSIDTSAADLLEHVERWIKVGDSARKPTMLTWNPEGGVFRKVAGSLVNYWSFADEISPKLMSLEVT
jgi:hypothetical protein